MQLLLTSIFFLLFFGLFFFEKTRIFLHILPLCVYLLILLLLFFGCAAMMHRGALRKEALAGRVGLLSLRRGRNELIMEDGVPSRSARPERRGHAAAARLIYGRGDFGGRRCAASRANDLPRCFVCVWGKQHGATFASSRVCVFVL